MAAHWPNEPDENAIARHLNATPKYVVTRTLVSLDWAGSQILDGDVVESVNDLKARAMASSPVLGSGGPVQTLIEHRLIDDYRLFVHPVVLCTGKRLFRETSRPLPMRLVDCTPTSTGILMPSGPNMVPAAVTLPSFGKWSDRTPFVGAPRVRGWWIRGRPRSGRTQSRTPTPDSGLGPRCAGTVGSPRRRRLRRRNGTRSPSSRHSRCTRLQLTSTSRSRPPAPSATWGRDGSRTPPSHR